MDKQYKIYVVDTETTGLNPEIHEVIELAMTRFHILNSKIESEESNQWLIKANNPSSVEDEALAVSGHKREDILHLSKFGRENYAHPKDAIISIENWIGEDESSCEDRIFVGQNPMFDLNMLEHMWKRLESKDSFPFLLHNKAQVIDTKMMAIMIDLCNSKKRPYYNLSSLVKDFGVKKGKAHRADEDVRMTKDLFIKMILPFVEAAKAFDKTYGD